MGALNAKDPEPPASAGGSSRPARFRYAEREPAPQLRRWIRYEVPMDDAGRWVERGYMSRDEGATWNQFMEMTLTRVP